MRTTIVPDSDFHDRVRRLQAELARADLDVLVTYSSESEPASSRYLADFWPFFDFAGVVVPQRGTASLVTGGPESYEFARQFSRIKNIHIHPCLSRSPRRTGFRRCTYEDFPRYPRDGVRAAARPRGRGRLEHLPAPHLRGSAQAAAGDAEIVPADDVLAQGQAIKSAPEIAAIRQAYWITEQAMIDVAATPSPKARRSGRSKPGRMRPCAGSARRALRTPSGCAPGRTRTRASAAPQTGASGETSWCSSHSAPGTSATAAICAARSPSARCPTGPRSSLSVALEGVRAALARHPPWRALPRLSSSITTTSWPRTGSSSSRSTARRMARGSSEVEGLWLGAGSETGHPARHAVQHRRLAERRRIRACASRTASS